MTNEAQEFSRRIVQAKRQHTGPLDQFNRERLEDLLEDLLRHFSAEDKK